MHHYQLDKAEQATWIHGKQPKKLTRGDKIFMTIGLAIVVMCALLAQ